MSRYNPLSDELLRLAVPLVPIFVVSVAVGAVADNFIAGHLIWGGQHCTESSGVYGCAGYMPLGFILIVFAVAVVASYAVTLMKRSENPEGRDPDA